MTPDPARLAVAERLGPKLREAMRRLDAQGIVDVLTDPSVERVEFAVGKNYRLAIMGAPPVRVDVEIPEPTDSVTDAITKLTGFDHNATAAEAAVLTIRATYRGRMTTPGLPHAFRMPNGQMAMLADMDVLAWELLT